MQPVPQPLKAVLAAQGRTQVWVAKQTGRSTRYVCDVTNGLRPPSPGFKADVARLLALPEPVLFREEWLAVAVS